MEVAKFEVRLEKEAATSTELRTALAGKDVSLASAAATAKGAAEVRSTSWSVSRRFGRSFLFCSPPSFLLSVDYQVVQYHRVFQPDWTDNTL